MLAVFFSTILQKKSSDSAKPLRKKEKKAEGLWGTTQVEWKMRNTPELPSHPFIS
jgi:hypothetical protein